MEVEIFVDVLFIVNFIIDYILLSVTSFFVRRRASIFRMICASSAGGIYSAAMFFIPLNTALSLLFSAVCALLMVVITFGVRCVGGLIKNISVFYLVSASIAGLGFSFIFSGNAGTHFAVNNAILYADINAYTLLFVFIVSVATIHIATGVIRKEKIKSCFIYDVTIEKDGRKISDTALFDSGNFLCDPLTQKSVLIAEWQSVSALFPESKITEAIVAHPEEFVYITCHSLGKESALFAFSPDGVWVDKTEFTEPVLVAVTENSLDKEGSYRILLPNTQPRQKGSSNVHSI